MQIDISQVLTIGRHLDRVSADARSYAQATDGAIRQALTSNDGFASIRQLGDTLDGLGRRRDRLFADTAGTARNVAAAAAAHSATDRRGGSTFDRLTGRLTGLAADQPSGFCPAPGGRTALASAGPITAPSPLAGWETMSERAQTGLGRVGNLSSWMTDAHYGRFAPRGPDGRFISPGTMSPWQRAVAGANGEFRATPHNSATRAAWSTAGTWAGRVGTGLSVATTTAGQVARDWNDPNLTTDQKVGRAGWRGIVEGGGTWGGGAAGAKVGAGIGTLVAPGIGTVIGGIIGGMAGGFVGSEVGGWVADNTVDAAGDVVERITPW